MTISLRISWVHPTAAQNQRLLHIHHSKHGPSAVYNPPPVWRSVGKRRSSAHGRFGNVIIWPCFRPERSQRCRGGGGVSGSADTMIAEIIDGELM